MIFWSVSWEDWSHRTDWMGMTAETPCLGAHSGSLKKTLIAWTHNLGAPGARATVWQQPWNVLLQLEIHAPFIVNMKTDTWIYKFIYVICQQVRVDNLTINHKNYNFLACDWFKNVLFSTNLLAKLLSDSLLLDSLLLDSLLSDSLISQSHSKM